MAAGQRTACSGNAVPTFSSMKDPTVDLSNGVSGLCLEEPFEAVGPWRVVPEPDMRLIPHDSELWEFW